MVNYSMIVSIKHNDMLLLDVIDHYMLLIDESKFSKKGYQKYPIPTDY